MCKSFYDETGDEILKKSHAIGRMKASPALDPHFPAMPKTAPTLVRLPDGTMRRPEDVGKPLGQIVSKLRGLDF